MHFVGDVVFMYVSLATYPSIGVVPPLAFSQTALGVLILTPDAFVFSQPPNNTLVLGVLNSLVDVSVDVTFTNHL